MSLTEFGPGIWLAEGPPVVAMAGFHYPTRMAVMRLHGTGLAVWSPIALTPGLRQVIETLGTVTHIIAPNSLHHLHVADWQQAFPQAQCHAAPGLPEKRPDLRFDHVLGDGSHPDWAGALDHVLFRGNAITTEAVFFHHPSGTVLFTDLLQQLPKGWFRGWRAVVARMDLMTGPEPAVPRKFRLAFTDRPAARVALARVRDWPAERVLMAHGAPVTKDARAFLTRAFAWL